MKKYLKIIYIYYKASIMLDLEYRSSLMSKIIANFSWTCFTLISTLLITSNVKTFGWWGRNEMLVITASWMYVNFIAYGCFYGNIKRLMRDIFNGNLDFYLIKPIDIQFIVSVQRFSIGAIMSLIQGTAILIFVFSQSSFSFNLLNLVGYIILLLVGASIYYSLWIFTSSVNIFSPLADNLFYLIPEINYVSKFPIDAFPKIISYFFISVVPLMLTTLLPSLILLGKLDLIFALYSIVLVSILFYFTRVFWNWSLRHYTSMS